MSQAGLHGDPDARIPSWRKASLRTHGKRQVEADTARCSDLLTSQERDARGLTREFRFEDFGRAFGLVVWVALLAEAEGHHPQMELEWGRAAFTTYSTYTRKQLRRSSSAPSRCPTTCEEVARRSERFARAFTTASAVAEFLLDAWHERRGDM